MEPGESPHSLTATPRLRPSPADPTPRPPDSPRTPSWKAGSLPRLPCAERVAVLSKASGTRPHAHSGASQPLWAAGALTTPRLAVLRPPWEGRVTVLMREPGGQAVLCEPLGCVLSYHRLSLGPGCQHGSRGGPSPCPSRVGGPFPEKAEGAVAGAAMVTGAWLGPAPGP